MSSKYNHVATVMNRHYVGVDNYMFSYDHAILGNYDEKSKIFTDIYGKEYNYMMSGNAITMDDPHAVYNIMRIEELKNHTEMKGKPIEDIIAEYIKQIEKIVYLIGYTDDFTPYISAINLDAYQREANSIKENGKSTSENNILSRMEQLMLDTVDGKFTKEQLIAMIENLMDVKETIENTIDTMDNKIGAMDENKTFREYIDEQLANPEDVVKPSNKDESKEDKPKEEPQPEKQEKKEEKPNTEKLKAELMKKYKPEQKNKDNKIVINPPKQIERIDIDEIYKQVTKTLIAQDEPARRVIVELARKEMEPSKKREAILLTGATGVGKTELMRLISTYMKKTLLIVDSTQITTAGYVGKDITEILWDLYVKCGKNKDKAEHAIIYFDEIDKKGSEKNDDVNGRGVLNALLPFIEGATYDAALDSKSTTQIVKLDTSNMTVIVGGAFSDMYKHLLKKNEIGFNTDKNSLDTPQYRKAEIKDFVEYGMMSYEFMGRVVPIKLNDLGRNEIKRVLLESDQSAIRKQEKIFKDLGVKITYTSEYIDKIVDKAYRLNTGARALNGIVDESTWRAFDEVYTHTGKYKELKLDANSVEDSSNYQLIKKR